MNVCIVPLDSSAEMLVDPLNGALAFTASRFLFCSMIFATTSTGLLRSAYTMSDEKIRCVVYEDDIFSVSFWAKQRPADSADISMSVSRFIVLSFS